MPECRLYSRQPAFERQCPLSWSGGSLHLGQPTAMGEVCQDRLSPNPDRWHADRSRQFGRKDEKIARQNADQDPNRFQRPNVLPISASRWCYLENLGQYQ